MIIADQHNKSPEKTAEKGTPRKPEDTRGPDGRADAATSGTGSARSALPHAGEPIGQESDTGTTQTTNR